MKNVGYSKGHSFKFKEDLLAWLAYEEFDSISPKEVVTEQVKCLPLHKLGNWYNISSGLKGFNFLILFTGFRKFDW